MANKEIDEMLDLIFTQAQMQFGSAIKSRWFHDGEGCPGCSKKIGITKYKGQDTVSINAFIFREHGVVIAYFLCGKCSRYIMKQSEKSPYTQTPLHTEIEKNLKQSFIKHLGH